MNLQLESTLFTLSNAWIIPFWALLIFAPNSKVTTSIFETVRFNPMHILAVIYGVLVSQTVIFSPQSLAVLAQPTLEGVQQLLGSPSGAAAGWIHYLCFDLYVGTQVWKAARARKHRFLWVSPVLFLVLMLGPLGWLIFEVSSRFSSRTQLSSSP